MGGLKSVDIPFSEVTEPFPVGPDLKTWQDSWLTVNDLRLLATHVCSANACQYHQVSNSPFCSDPLLSYLGYKADTVSGILPPENILSSLSTETRNLCQTMATFSQESRPVYPEDLTLEMFKSLYKALDEHTSSSPSGWHLGHYKAAIQSELLSQVHSQLMSIPTLTSISPTKWQQVVDIMLEKKPGDRRIHCLRIIVLHESDFNQVNQLLVGQPVQFKLEDRGLLPDIQHGSRTAKQCHSAVLNKVLTFEIHRYKCSPLAYIENDAVGCFDRIANPLVLVFLCILGLAAPTLESLARTWENSYHRICSLYGISKEIYANEWNRLLFGPGQGSTIGPYLWLLCFLLIASSLSSSCPKMEVSLVNYSPLVKYVGEAFMDDTGLGTNQLTPGSSANNDTSNQSPLITNLQ